jgi:hypothetical protein
MLRAVLLPGSLNDRKILLLLLSLAWIPFSLATAPQESRPDAPLKASDGDMGMVIPPDYFPLNPGNRWIYSKTDSRFKKTDTVRIEIVSTPIIKWKTYYVFNQLPFVPGLEAGNNILVRYDNATKRYLRLTQDGEMPLFPVGPEADAKFDASVDASNNPVANRMSYLTCLRCSDAGIEVVFDRGIGIVAIQSTFIWGAENYELKSALVNWQNFGEPMVDEKASVKEPKTGPVVSRADPNLSLEVEKVEQGAKLIFRVKNPTESFLSFSFTSSQTYDFVVRQKENRLEIWRWSKGNFFSQVLRNVALLPQKEWIYEEVWNYKDNERNDVKQGAYEAVAILTTKQPLESAPVEIVVP